MKFFFSTVLFIASFSVFSQTTEQSPSPHTQMPSFPGGVHELLLYVYRNLEYPAEALRNKISGTVSVEFIITEEGFIADPIVINGVGFGCDEEALRIVDSMNEKFQWEPGLKEGRPVPVTMTLPITFQIAKKSKT